MSEYIKYNPANYSPEHLLHPPTENVNEELRYLTSQLKDLLETPSGNSKHPNQLLAGAEYEIIFFSPDADPGTPARSNRKNPNYQRLHQQKMLKLGKWAGSISKRKRKPNQFMECERYGKLMIEFRTKPEKIDQHISTAAGLRDLLRAKAKELNVLPVVHSHHIHLSLIRDNGYNFIDAERTRIFSNYKSKLSDGFSRVRTLVMLPEEYHAGNLWEIDQTKGNGRDCPKHTEFRLLSSEYATDPILNLTLSLRALSSALLNKPLTTQRYPPKTFVEEVKVMSRDEELKAFFGESTLRSLAKSVSQYPDVSKRKITVDEISMVDR